MDKQKGSGMSELKKQRLSAGITQVELAKRTGMKQPYIARYESKAVDINQMSIENGYRIASAIGCRIEDIMEKGAIKSATV